jgi:acyl dehydratase
LAAATIDDIEVGASHSEAIDLTSERMRSFIDFTRDSAGIHTSRSFSAEKGFENLVVHGFLLSVHFSRILGMELPGENAVIGSMELNFHEPVYVGDRVTYTATVKRVLRPLGAVHLDLLIEKSDGTLCVEGKTVCAFKK